MIFLAKENDLKIKFKREEFSTIILIVFNNLRQSSIQIRKPYLSDERALISFPGPFSLLLGEGRVGGSGKPWE